MLSVIVVVAGCRRHCWGTADLEEKSDHGRRESNRVPNVRNLKR